MRIYMVAGEASGDLHGSNLIKAIRTRVPAAEIRCWGGDMMEAAGGQLVKHYRDLAFMGFAEVMMNLRTILRNIAFCKQDIKAYGPDVLVLVDYPGFNLRIARWAKKQGLKVVYYIAPQVWAWKPGRVKMMKQCIDQLLTILPFEPPWFQTNWNWQVAYVGHPLLEAVDGFEDKLPPLSQMPIVAVLPGSRKQEISKKLPIMLEVAQRFPAYKFIVAMAPGMDETFYKPYLAPYPNAAAVKGITYSLLRQAKAALVTSGTATLETALFGVPEVVCYKGSPISYAIARRLVKIKYISLVNLILDAPVVKELIQHELTVENATAELQKILQDKGHAAAMQEAYSKLRGVLHAGKPASVLAAEYVLVAGKKNK